MWKVLLAGFGLSFCLITASVQAAESTPARIVSLSLAKGSITGPDVRARGGIRWLKVEQGETIEMRWTTDENVILLLQGYNVTLRMAKGARSAMRVRADASGRFPLVVRTAAPSDGNVAQPPLRMPFFVEVRPRREPDDRGGVMSAAGR